MSKKQKENTPQGTMQFFIEYKDGKKLSKYNEDGTKNVYHYNGATLDRSNIKKWGFTDTSGNVIVSINVPDEAVVFQRRRQWIGGSGINLNDEWRTVETTVPETMMALVDGGEQGMVWVECQYDSDLGKYVSPKGAKQHRLFSAHKIMKSVPAVTYTECWLIGWRKREADNSITMQFSAVYPDGTVEDYTAFGVKPWLYEPQWFNEEKV